MSTVELTSADFKQTVIFYASGIEEPTVSGQYAYKYVTLMYRLAVTPGSTVSVTTNLSLGTDSGFHWYDKDMNWLSGSIAPTISGATMSCVVPDNAAYCRFNIQGTSITPASITSCTVDGVNGIERVIPFVFFRRRPKVETAKPVAVTITGIGHSDRCYATVNGTKYTATASGIEVMAGDVITFGIYGISSFAGTVKVDDETVFTNSGGNGTYDWTVPEGITEISIALSVIYNACGRITVTTS